MQCLEKDPSRRYQAVNELVADLDRYLRHKPILARPPSLIYAVRKLAGRNRIALASVLAAATFLLFLSTFAVIMTIQAQRIAAERDRAEHEKQQAQKASNVALGVLSIADPSNTLANEVNAPAVLEQAARSIKRELRDNPAARARLLEAVGLAYVRRGEPRPAIDYLRDAAQTLGQVPGAETETLRATVDLSLALRMSGKFSEARQVLLDGERIAKRSGIQRTAAYARLLLNRGRIHAEESQIPEARADFERSLQLYQEVLGTQSVEVAEVLSELSMILLWTDDHHLAEQTARESIEIFDRTVPPMYPDRVQTEVRLAEALYLQNRLDESAAMYIRSLEKSSELFGRNSADVADILDRLAMVRYSERRLAQSEMYSRQAVATARIAYGDRHPLTASIAATLGRTLAERGKYSEAEARLREALAIFAETLPPDHQYVASAEYFLGEILLATNRLGEAESVLAASMNRWKRSGAPQWRAMRSASALGEALYRQGRTQDAGRYLSESFKALSADTTPDAEAREKARQRFEHYARSSLGSASPGRAPPRRNREINAPQH